MMTETYTFYLKLLISERVYKRNNSYLKFFFPNFSF